MTKEQLRTKLQRDIRSISSSDREQKSRKACKNVIQTPEFQQAGTVMVYLALPDEIDTHEIILAGWQQNKLVCAPKISWRQRHMIPVRISTLETGFSTEVANLRNPTEGTPVPFGEIDFIVIPGLGFDKNGSRLGRGASYYDRFLSNHEIKGVRCGLGFEKQLIDYVPVKHYDEPMDLVITDRQVIRCKRKK